MNSVAYLAAEALTAAAISRQTDKVAAANVAANVSAFFSSAGKGDVAGATNAVQIAIANIKDPGLAKLANDLWSAGQPFLQADLQVAENVPVLGGSLSQALTDVGSGMAAAAGAYLAPAPAGK